MEPNSVIEAIKVFNNVWEFLSEIRKILAKSKKGGWKLLGSKKTEIVERKFKEALEGTKSAIESSIWYGKGFAIQAECGVKVDKEFHHLMALLISFFSDFSMRLVPEKLDEKLVEHLQSQLKTLEEYAQRFWDIQGFRSYPEKEKEEKATIIIENFRSRMWDFRRSMEPYLKTEETKPT